MDEAFWEDEGVESAGGGTSSYQLEGGGSIPTSTLFRKQDWWVSDVEIVIARRLVRKWHYAVGASNTATYLHGLFPRRDVLRRECVGCAWWIPPTKTAATSLEKDGWEGVLSLHRLAIADGIPKNAASFLIRHSMDLINRARWPVLVTYADRWRQHIGTIYRASGWKEDGTTSPERRYVMNGRLVSRKAGPRTRTHSEMLGMGCECVGSFSAIRFVHRVEGRKPYVPHREEGIF